MMRKFFLVSLLALTCLSSLAWAGEASEPQYQEEILVTTGRWTFIARQDVQFTYPMPGRNRFATVTINLEQHSQKHVAPDNRIQAKQYGKYIGALEVLLHTGRPALGKPYERINIPRKIRYVAPYPDLERASFGILSGSDPDEKDFAIAAVYIPFGIDKLNERHKHCGERSNPDDYLDTLRIGIYADGRYEAEIMLSDCNENREGANEDGIIVLKRN